MAHRRTSKTPRRTSRRNPSWPWSKQDGELLRFEAVHVESDGKRRRYTRDEYVAKLCHEAIAALTTATSYITKGHRFDVQPAALSFVLASHRWMGEARALASLPNADGNDALKMYRGFEETWNYKYSKLQDAWPLLPGD